LSRDGVLVGLFWLILTVVGEMVALRVEFFPSPAADQATIIDDSFRMLVLLAIPVMAFVIAMLVYSALRFRHRGDPLADGPPTQANKKVLGVWFGVTTALTVLMIVNPGITGLNELWERADEPVDMVIEVEGSQFFWRATYAEYGFSTFSGNPADELVLPLGAHVRFAITSRDVLHSFWIPAFRMKIDAVPGMTTAVHVRPTKLGDPDEDINFRVQCAELCGVLHGQMTMPVRVVSQLEFEEWAKARQQ
jgi:cytochrome c oxidase subunit II